MATEIAQRRAVRSPSASAIAPKGEITIAATAVGRTVGQRHVRTAPRKSRKVNTKSTMSSVGAATSGP